MPLAPPNPSPAASALPHIKITLLRDLSWQDRALLVHHLNAIGYWVKLLDGALQTFTQLEGTLSESTTNDIT